jgi:hypothetical protein
MNPGKMGISGRSASSAIEGPGLPSSDGLPSVGLSGTDTSSGRMLFLSTLGTATCCSEPSVELLRSLASVLGVIKVLAIGDAVSTVPEVAIGGG